MPFQHLGDAGVELLTPWRLAERAVGDILNQGVLEPIAGVGRHAAPKDQLGRHQLVEGRAQLRFGPRGERLEQLMGESRARSRRRSERLRARAAEAIETGHEESRRVAGIERRQQAGELEMVARGDEQTRLQHHLGQLLDEQRHAVGARDDLLEDLGWQTLAPVIHATMARTWRRLSPANGVATWRPRQGGVKPGRR